MPNSKQRVARQKHRRRLARQRSQRRKQRTCKCKKSKVTINEMYKDGSNFQKN